MSAPGLRTPEGNRCTPAADVTPGPLKWPLSQSPGLAREVPIPTLTPTKCSASTSPTDRGKPARPQKEQELQEPEEEQHPDVEGVKDEVKHGGRDSEPEDGSNADVISIGGRTGWYVDCLELHFTDGTSYVCGSGTGGSPVPRLSLSPGETIRAVEQVDGGFYLGASFTFHTSLGKALEIKGSHNSKKRKPARRFEVPPGHVLRGFKFENSALVDLHTVASEAKGEAARKAKVGAESKEEELRAIQKVAAKEVEQLLRFKREHQRLTKELQWERHITDGYLRCLFQAQSQPALSHTGWPGTGAAHTVAPPLQALPPPEGWPTPPGAAPATAPPLQTMPPPQGRPAMPGAAPAPAPPLWALTPPQGRPAPPGPMAFRPSSLGSEAPVGPLPSGLLLQQAQPQLPAVTSGGRVPAAFRPCTVGTAPLRPQVRPQLLKPNLASGGPAPSQPSAPAPAPSTAPAAHGAPPPGRAPFQPSALALSPSARPAAPGRPPPPAWGSDGGPATPAPHLQPTPPLQPAPAPADLPAAQSREAGKVAAAPAVSCGLARPPQLGQSLVPRPPRVPPPADVLLRRTGKTTSAPQLPEEVASAPTTTRSQEAAKPRQRSRSRSRQRTQLSGPPPASARAITPPRGSRPPATPQRARRTSPEALTPPWRQSASWQEGHASDWEAEDEERGNDQWQLPRTKECYQQAEWEEEEEGEDTDEESRHPGESDEAEDWNGSSGSSARNTDKENVHVVPVRGVRYSQTSIKGHFRRGGELWSLLEQLQAGSVDPLRDDFLALDAYKIGKTYLSRNNRRLYCLKQYQESVKHEVKVKLKVNLNPSQKTRRRLRQFTTKNGGKAVAVRHNWTKASHGCTKRKEKASSRGRKPKGAEACTRRSTSGWGSGWKRGKGGHWERTWKEQDGAGGGWKEQDGAGGGEAVGAKIEAHDASDSDDWGEWSSKQNAASDEKCESDSWGAWKSHGSGN